MNRTQDVSMIYIAGPPYNTLSFNMNWLLHRVSELKVCKVLGLKSTYEKDKGLSIYSGWSSKVAFA